MMMVDLLKNERKKAQVVDQELKRMRLRLSELSLCESSIR